METIIRILKRRGLAVKLSFFTLIGTTLIFVASFAYNYWYSSRLVLQNVEADARKDPQLREIGEAMIHGKTGFVPYQSFYLNHIKSDDITILALRYDGNRSVPEPI